MGGLVVLAGALTLSSGMTKVLGKGRTPGAIPLLALLELIAGVGVPLFVLNVGPSPAVTRNLVFLLIALVFISTLSRARTLKAQRRRRELTESARLSNYVNRLSTLNEDAGDPTALED